CLTSNHALRAISSNPWKIRLMSVEGVPGPPRVSYALISSTIGRPRRRARESRARTAIICSLPGGTMSRLMLAGAIALLAGCVAPIEPQTSVEPAPSLEPPRILHRLVLASPQGQGTLEIRRESRWQDGTATVTDRASGAIVTTDDVGNWRFAYTKTSLEGVGLTQGEWLVGLHALSVILPNTSGGDVDIDWEQSVFVDPSGRTHRTIHRGVQLNQLMAPMIPSRVAAGATLDEFIFPAGGVHFSAPPGRASLWHAPAVFERLVPGSGFSITLALKRGEIAAPRTFTFSAIAASPS